MGQKILKELMEREPDIVWEKDGSNGGDIFHGLSNDDQLMSPDQASVCI